MKKLFLVTLLHFVFTSGYSQQDSLKILIEEQKDCILKSIENTDLRQELKCSRERLRLNGLISKHDTAYAEALMDVGQGLIKSKSYLSTIDSFFFPAKEIFEKSGDTLTRGYAFCLTGIGNVYFGLGQKYKAKEYLENALTYWEIAYKTTNKETTLFEWNVTKGNIGLLKWQLFQEFEEGIALMNSSKEVLKKILLKDPNHFHAKKNLGLSTSNIGLYHFYRNNTAEAKNHFEEASRIFKELNDENNYYYGIAIYHLGLMALNDNNLIKAEELLNKSKDIFKIANSPFYGMSLSQLGLTYIYLGQLNKAEKLVIESIKMLGESIGINHPQYTANLSILGIIYFQQGLNTKRDSMLLLAKNLLEKNHNTNSFEYYGILANLSTSTIHPIDSVETWLKKSLDGFTKVFKNDFYQYTTLGKLGQLYHEKNDYQKAYEYYLRARQNNRFNNLYADKVSVFLLEMVKIKNYEKEYETADSLLNLFTTSIVDQFQNKHNYLSESEQISFFNAITHLYDHLFYLYEDSEHLDITIPFEFNLALKGVGLQKSILKKNKAILGNKEIVSKKQKWEKLRSDYSKSYRLSAEALNANHINLNELQLKINNLEKELNQLIGVSNRAVKNIKLKDIQSNLKTDDIAIDFISYRSYDKTWTGNDNRYMAILVFPKQLPKLINLDHKTIDLLLKESNYKNSFIHKANYNHLLYKAVWQPIEKYCKNSKTIHVSPSGKLHSLPFEALLVNDSTYLGDQYNFRYYSNLGNIINRQDIEAHREVVSLAVFGGANYDTTGTFSNTRGYEKGIFTTLSGAKEEVQFLKNLTQKIDINNTYFYTDSISTEANFKQSILNKEANHIHFSDHAFFEPPVEVNADAMNFAFIDKPRTVYTNYPLFRSGLVFNKGNLSWAKRKYPGEREDDLFTAYEMAHFDMSHVELMVLSACETALGDVHVSEGVLGMQSTLKQAGVKNLIMSLWEVDDKKTKELMELFYHFYLEKKQTVREALRNAKMDMRKRKISPYYWAGFILIE